MSRSLFRLRRGIFGIAFAASLGFGVTQALASPTDATARTGYCEPDWEQWCSEQCAPNLGRCHWYGFYYCECIFA
jgi:hypothetical protein